MPDPGPDPREARLPQWAQNELANLRSRPPRLQLRAQHGALFVRPDAPDGLCRRPDHAGHIEAVTPACRLWHFHHLPLARTAALTATELLHRRLQWDRIPNTGGPSILHAVFPPDAWSYR